MNGIGALTEMDSTDDTEPRQAEMARATELAEIKDDYDALLKEHGNVDKPEVVGWLRRDDQITRYKVLTSLPDYREPGKVLEVGCGRGGIMKVPGRPISANYTGIDFIPEHITWAREHYKLGNMTWLYGEAIEYLSDTTNKWDTVIASGVLAHYSGGLARQLLARMWFVTEEGGYMAFNWNRLTCGITDRDMLIILKDLGVERYMLRHDYLANDYTAITWKQ